MKRLVPIAVSLGILATLYSQLDLEALTRLFAQVDGHILALAMALFVPILVMPAYRLRWLTPQALRMKLREAMRLIITASVFNMILPSRMGDLVKAYFMTLRSEMKGSLCLSLMVFEKSIDMIGLLFWAVIGLVLYPRSDEFFWAALVITLAGLVFCIYLVLFSRRLFTVLERIFPISRRNTLEKLAGAWMEVHEHLNGNRIFVLQIIAYSVVLWFIHMVQLWLFVLAINAYVPFVDTLGLMPLGILAGLIPLTFAGIGIRDAALIYLFLPYFSAETGAALGLLATARYFVPALVGLPFMGPYLSLGYQQLSEWSSKQTGRIDENNGAKIKR